MNLNNLRLDIQKYTDFKNKGLISFSVNGDQVFVSQKQFDPNTGNALPDQITQIAVSDIQNKIADLQSQIDNLNAMLVDTNTAIAAAQPALGVVTP